MSAYEVIWNTIRLCSVLLLFFCNNTTSESLTGGEAQNYPKEQTTGKDILEAPVPPRHPPLRPIAQAIRPRSFKETGKTSKINVPGADNKIEFKFIQVSDNKFKRRREEDGEQDGEEDANGGESDVHPSSKCGGRLSGEERQLRFVEQQPSRTRTSQVPGRKRIRK